MRSLTTILTILFAAGCSTTATIYKKDGSVVKAEIKRSDRTTIYTIHDGSNKEQAIARDEINDIDHPGNVAAAFGTTLGVVALPFAIWSYILVKYTTTSNDWEPWTLTLIAADFSIIVYGIWGWYTWGSSRSAAAPPEEPTGPKITPVALTDGERTYWGLGMSWRW